MAFLAGAMLLAATWTGGAPASASAPPALKPTQELVVLFKPLNARAKPSVRAKSLGLLPSRRPLTRVRTALPVLGHRTVRGGKWLLVRLPGRPNGRTGWIRARGTGVARTKWHLVVDTSSRRVIVYKLGRRYRVFDAIVGATSTPTPHGRFFVEESVRLPTNAIGGPFALALSARSNVFQEFAGGPGQIGLHGLINVGGTLRTAVSHGCVRLGNETMRWLVARIGPGTPVTVKD